MPFTVLAGDFKKGQGHIFSDGKLVLIKPCDDNLKEEISGKAIFSIAVKKTKGATHGLVPFECALKDGRSFVAETDIATYKNLLYQVQKNKKSGEAATSCVPVKRTDKKTTKINTFGRRAGKEKNQINQSMGALVGVVQGILGDGILTDDEIHFLKKWMMNNDTIRHVWPADIVFSKLKEALADGVVTEEKRESLIEVLRKFVGGDVANFTEKELVTELAFDKVDLIDFDGMSFCLTGNFSFASRAKCCEAIEERGGFIEKSVTEDLDYLVVGGLGSDEWKHGSFGRKIERAMEHKRSGVPLLIVSENVFVESLLKQEPIDEEAERCAGKILIPNATIDETWSVVSIDEEEISLDEVDSIDFNEKTFRLTGVAMRDELCAAITERGGRPVGAVSKKLNYLVVGEERRNFETIQIADKHRGNGAPLLIISADVLEKHLFGAENFKQGTKRS